jgi:hypothetical protein
MKNARTLLAKGREYGEGQYKLGSHPNARRPASQGAPKLPAYGRDVPTARRAGLSPTRWLCVMRDWPRRTWPWLVIVSAGDDPAQYDLSLCAGLPVIVSCAATDNSNAVLVSLIEEAEPEIGAVIVDGEFSVWIEGDHE